MTEDHEKTMQARQAKIDPSTQAVPLRKEQPMIIKALAVAATLIGLFVIQRATGKLGWAVADWFQWEKIDPDQSFTRLSMHHLVQMILVAALIWILKRFIQKEFGFQTGDVRTGGRIVLIFSLSITGIALAYHLLMQRIGNLPVYAYPLSVRNVLGSLGFQLLICGPSEEIVYRALPVTLLLSVFGRSIRITEDISLEVVLTALLFAAAHVSWSGFPASVREWNLFPLLYAFAMGVLNGAVYQKTRSILYPMAMHSISNFVMVGTGYLFHLLQQA